MKGALSAIHLSDRGVYVQSSTLGSLEALLTFLKQSKIPVRICDMVICTSLCMCACFRTLVYGYASFLMHTTVCVSPFDAHHEMWGVCMNVLGQHTAGCMEC